MAMNSDLTNLGVSKTTSIAPPPVQKFNIQMVITHEPLILEKIKLSTPEYSHHADHIQ